MTPRQSVDAALLGVGCWLVSAAASAAPTFERVLDTPCRAIALDQPPYWAALGDEAVTVSDKRGIHTEALPQALRGAAGRLGVFFGRDYRVRIAGTMPTPKGDEARYYRSLASGLRPAPDELGPLGKPGAPALLTLLGTADPEIVCRPGMSCLIKRVSGWAKASAPSDLERVGLSLGDGWALAGSRLLRLGKDWEAAYGQGPWRRADDAALRGQHACVAERDASKLHHFDGQGWHSSASPVKGPRSLWASESALWVAGDGGVARGADDGFKAIGGVSGAAQVLGRSDDDVWLCGASGVFRTRK